MPDPVPYARQCCPASALAALTPDELRHLDRYCRRVLADPDAEPRDGDEATAVARYEGLLDGWGHAWRCAERGR